LKSAIFGPGHTANRRASVINLYLHTTFHWNRKNFSWTDGRTYWQTFQTSSNVITSTRRSWPKN